MLKKLCFLDAHQLMCDCERAVEALKLIFGQAMMETIHDAMNRYAQTPAYHGCEEEADYAALFSLALSQAGFNTLNPENDVTRELLMAPSKEDK